MPFSFLRLAILCTLCALAAFIDAIAGGGGLISLPAYLAIGLPTHTAMGSNKFSAMWGSAVALVRYARNRQVVWSSALIAVATSLVGAWAGTRLALWLNASLLQLGMLAVLPVVAVVVLTVKPKAPTQEVKNPVRVLVFSALLGLLIGGYDGLIGPGTGTFLVIGFTWLCNMQMLTATGNAKAVNLASNLASGATFLVYGQVDFRYALPAAACALLGGFLGAGLALRKGTRAIRVMLLVVLAMLFVKMAADAWQNLL